jgi:hypothetical protein
MGIEIYGIIEKVQARDQRVVQQSSDQDGILASFYDLSGNPSIFMSGASANLGYVGIKTITPNEALTVVGNVSSSSGYYGPTFNSSGNLEIKTPAKTWTFNNNGTLTLPASGILKADGANLYIGSNLIPTTSAFYIGDINNPVQGIYLAANTLNLASNTAGVSGLALSNVNNNLTITSGGLSSTKIYTGGLLISGHNIAADPNVSSQPMTIGSGLSAVQVLTPLTIQGTLSTSGLISQQQNFCVASLTAHQSMTSSDTAIQFVDKTDPNNWWNSSTYKFVPTVAGYYNIMVMVNWVGINAEVQVNNQIRKNGNTVALNQMPIPKSQTHSLFLQAIVHMNGTTDAIDVSGYTGSNTTITGESGGNWTKFEAYKIC